jgi:hypothetical protein
MNQSGHVFYLLGFKIGMNTMFILFAGFLARRFLPMSSSRISGFNSGMFRGMVDRLVSNRQWQEKNIIGIRAIRAIRGFYFLDSYKLGATRL